jgi:hypothetical protein
MFWLEFQVAWLRAYAAMIEHTFLRGRIGERDNVIKVHFGGRHG